MRTPGADSAGKLVATMLEVALAEVAEPERLRRGRRYARQGAVNNLVVAPRVVTGTVQGSRAQPYEVEIRILGSPPAAPPRLADLVPKSGHLSFRCTCPDWELPCKHGVAVMTQLAERVAYDARLLATWRGIADPAGEDAGPPADEPSPAAGTRLDGNSTPDRDLAEFLGEMPAVELPALSPLPHVTMSWDEPWSVMLHDALRVITGAAHHH